MKQGNPETLYSEEQLRKDAALEERERQSLFDQCPGLPSPGCVLVSFLFLPILSYVGKIGPRPSSRAALLFGSLL